MKLTSDQLEALIVQAVDGTLGDLDRRALEERLAVDAEARLMLHEHQRLSDALRAMPMLEPMPAIDFNQLSSRISAAIEREPAFVSQPVRMTSIWIRRLSIAAGVAVLAGVGWMSMPQFSPGPRQDEVASEVKPADPAGGAATTEIIVRGPSIEQPKQAIEINIAVGPTPAMAERGMTHGLADDAFAAPTPKIVIGAGDANAPTTDERLY